MTRCSLIAFALLVPVYVTSIQISEHYWGLDSCISSLSRIKILITFLVLVMGRHAISVTYKMQAIKNQHAAGFLIIPRTELGSLITTDPA
jgi:hypothetical protein